MLRAVAVFAVLLSLPACSKTRDPPKAAPDKPPEQPAAGDPELSLQIDPAVCESHQHQYAWDSGTDRIAVEGIHSGACKIVVSRERNGATKIYACLLPTETGVIDLQRDPGEPFRVAPGRLLCTMMAHAHADGTVTDTRDDRTTYEPF